MGKFHDQITEHHADFIKQQHIFFVSTAPLQADGHINLSPKGLNCFKVLSPNRVAYLDLISSGNETSAHTLENGRITFMFCSFDEKPMILRLYGKGYTVLQEDGAWKELAPHFTIYPGTRQIIVADITKVQTSCGFGVPQYVFKADRENHFEWAATKGPDGLELYLEQYNINSIDGLPSNIALRKKMK